MQDEYLFRRMDVGGGFHFTRTDNGTVVLQYIDKGSCLAEAELSAPEWAAIVAQVSFDGMIDITQKVALNLHMEHQQEPELLKVENPEEIHKNKFADSTEGKL